MAVIAIRQGTTAALLTALGAFVIYNLLFVEPRFTLTVARPEELITLFLLLFVGVVIGRLGGAQRDRSGSPRNGSARRGRPSRSRASLRRRQALGRDRDRPRAGPRRRGDDAGVGQCRLDGSRGAPGADIGGASMEPVGTHSVLQSERPEDAATWVRSTPEPAGRRERRGPYRVALVADGKEIGSLWSERPSKAGEPTIEETRLLVATADQVAQASSRPARGRGSGRGDRAAERRAPVGLLDSVSHDLRTPLATIRAAAGSLADPAIELDDAERRATARAIDDEAERMNRLVDSPARYEPDPIRRARDRPRGHPLTELLDPILERYRPRGAGRRVVEDPPTTCRRSMSTRPS